jgi:bifunctional non-homologous end joining protein LigD
VLRLPEPTLARSGPIPTRAGWRFEPKCDGYRCLVCTHDGRFRARSRRGWNMTPLLSEFAGALPVDVRLDGELVALDANGHPDFHALGRRMLHGDTSVPVTLMVFDVLAVGDRATTMLPYRERRALLDDLDVEGPHVRLVATFDDGPALYDAVRAWPRGRRREAGARPVPAR